MQGVDNKIKETTVPEVSQQLDETFPTKRRVDVDAKVLTRNCLDRVYLNTVDKVYAKDDVKNEFKRVGFQTPEKASGSGEKANYADDTSKPRGRPRKKLQVADGDENPESSIAPRGEAGRPSTYVYENR